MEGVVGSIPAAPTILAPVLALLLIPAAIAAPAHKLECPVVAPAEWHIGAAPLAGVEVLSAPAGTKIDESSRPSLVPDENRVRGGTLHQAWVMNGEGPGWVFYVDCHYAGSDRILRLEASGVKRCERSVTHFSTSAGADAKWEQRMACD